MAYGLPRFSMRFLISLRCSGNRTNCLERANSCGTTTAPSKSLVPRNAFRAIRIVVALQPFRSSRLVEDPETLYAVLELPPLPTLRRSRIARSFREHVGESTKLCSPKPACLGCNRTHVGLRGVRMTTLRIIRRRWHISKLGFARGCGV